MELAPFDMSSMLSQLQCHLQRSNIVKTDAHLSTTAHLQCSSSAN